jgi:hypothetical protein
MHHARLVSEVANILLSGANCTLTCLFRCTATANVTLTLVSNVRRSQAHTELLVEEFELGMHYGMSMGWLGTLLFVFSLFRNLLS